MKKLIAVILMIATLTAVIPFGVSAEGQMPFKDVRENHWFYKAVKYTYERGIFSANNAAGDMFGPNVAMTRGMFVTVLFRLSGVDQSLYTGKTVFTDVPVDQWYAKAVQWANEKSYVAGMTDTTFSPNGKITRAQMARILSLYAKGEDGYDLSNVRSTAFEKFTDASKVQSWAKEGITWMSSTGLISGMATENGGPVLNPNSTATRAQAAQILMGYMELYYGEEYPVGSLTLGGSDISEFTIVYGNGYIQAAEFVQTHIKAATGVELISYADSEHPYIEGAKEILIGRTNREGSVVNVDRTDFNDTTYLYEMQGDHLILASNEKRVGTYYAATRFLKDIAGVCYYGRDLVTYTAIKAASIEDGTRVSGSSGFEYTSNFQDDGDDYFLGGYDEGEIFLNASHNLPALACVDPDCDGASDPISYYHHTLHYLKGNPCLTDPVIIDRIIENVGAILSRDLGDDREATAYVWLNQDDSASYCRCDHCSDVYRVWGRSAPYVQIMTYVSEAFATKYPNVKFVAFSYRHTATAPKGAEDVDGYEYESFIAKYGDQKYVPAKDITPPDNCVLMIKTDDTGCSSHPRNDTTCKRNKAYLQRFEGWCNIYENVCLHHFMEGNVSPHTPFPNIYEIWEDFNFVSAYPQVKWIRTIGGFGSGSSDFVQLRTYLVSELYRDPEMTWNEYSDLVNDYLKSAYGDGWSYIREYIDTLESLSSKNCWWTYEGIANHWNEVITEEQWRSGGYKYCRDLVERAIELSSTDAELTEARKTALQMKYIECQLAYSDGLDSFTELCNDFARELADLGYKIPVNMTDICDPDDWIYE